MIMLQIVIGLVFVMLLLSLLATTLMELIASGLALRGKNLEKALRNMLASAGNDETLYKNFKQNPLFTQLSQKFFGRKYSPSYMSADSFQSILLHTILGEQNTDKLIQQIEEIPDENLRKVLKQFLSDANHELDAFKGKIQKWYDDVMDRASGWYKRYTQKILVFVGLVIALVFNADAIAIYKYLGSNPENLAAVLSLAESFVEKNQEMVLDTNIIQVDSITYDTAVTFKQNPDAQIAALNVKIEEVKGLINNEIQAVKTPLGLGWSNFDYEQANWYDWVLKALGWIVTALAISLGAPFWFDILKKLVNIRSAGQQSS